MEHESITDGVCVNLTKVRELPFGDERTKLLGYFDCGRFHDRSMNGIR